MTMRQVVVIALNTFRENLRDKILYNLLFFALLLIGTSVLLADLTVMEHHKMVTDMGLAAINLIGVVIAIFVELLLVTALALFFSTFSTSTLSAILTFGLYVIGHLTNDLKGVAEQSKSETVQVVMTGLYYLCPNLEALNVKGQAASGVPVEMSYQMLASVYGLLYTALLMTAACAVFRRRDF